ncbi:type III-B CRISPR module RAMP protein Cmr6 [Calidithermus roseus]|uniref:CRISPR type III-B/RAMP module RAMP protein Cmr6 n=1 Tax=Calidithermus roseus TaxID=1644118 RepID=A0A399EUV3_9DEIN|nr:type III-B CRISPR module RAMP protein Cmr6 [Calidithermus roseus]RIH86869.1 CRISPR type III-B/RAMP module RAMP protein Cmr6 [Calidithermus roseus]
MRASRLNLPPPPHAGLALQRYLKQQDDENASARELLTHIANSQVSTVYRTAFERWKESLKGAIWLEATTRTPLAIGLGNSSPLENGLALHHTYGTPYLPGSALKGLLRRVAERYGLTEQEKAVLLGEGPDPKRKNQGNAAYLVYWDGWLDPASSQPFQSDVITVHHREYYGKKGAVWPTDFDDPNPVAFLSVKPGVKFCIPITSPAENAQDWPYKAAEMLKWGLENLGLGGKTNAGYGYFEVRPPEKPKTDADIAQEIYLEFRPLIERIKLRDPMRDVREIAAKLKKYPLRHRSKTIEAIVEHLKSIGVGAGDIDRIRAMLEET